jgi:hypothetical protein
MRVQFSKANLYTRIVIDGDSLSSLACSLDRSTSTSNSASRIETMSQYVPGTARTTGSVRGRAGRASLARPTYSAPSSVRPGFADVERAIGTCPAIGTVMAREHRREPAGGEAGWRRWSDDGCASRASNALGGGRFRLPRGNLEVSRQHHGQSRDVCYVIRHVNEPIAPSQNRRLATVCLRYSE